MSVQHVQQLQANYAEVVERPTFTRGGRSVGLRARTEGTVESGYIVAYLKYLLGERKTLPPLSGLTPRKAECLRGEVERELAR